MLLRCLGSRAAVLRQAKLNFTESPEPKSQPVFKLLSAGKTELCLFFSPRSFPLSESKQMRFASLCTPPAQVRLPGGMQAVAEDPCPAEACPRATTNFCLVWRLVSPLPIMVTGSRDTIPLSASFLKLMSHLTPAGPPGKPLPEPCCSHGYKLLSFPALFYLWMTCTHLALFFLYPNWLLAQMALFPALVFILQRAVPSAVGLPT